MFEPRGNHPIHIIVSKGNVRLEGVVDTVGDKAIADGLIQGYVVEGHNTGGRFNWKIVWLYDDLPVTSHSRRCLARALSAFLSPNVPNLAPRAPIEVWFGWSAN